MQFTLTIELGDDAAKMNHYASQAIAAAFLRSPGQPLGFLVDGGATVGKWEVTETPRQTAAALCKAECDARAKAEAAGEERTRIGNTPEPGEWGGPPPLD